MKTISNMAKEKLSECLGKYEELGFTLIVGTHSLLLYFKETVLHSFSSDGGKPITADEIQGKCKEYIDKLNAEYN